jgi:7-carboxy-7-deazaguanine synthase
MNKQPIQRADYTNGTLKVHSIFDTIQGEGPLAGIPATFVRLWGCNLQCPACDTEYTSQLIEMPFEEIATQCGRTHIVLTGGEPLRQKVSGFVDHVHASPLNKVVQIETNGTAPYMGDTRDVVIVCSPKVAHIHEGLQPHAWKYVLSADSICPEDGLPLTVLGRPVRPARPPKTVLREWDLTSIYVQPEDSGNPDQNAKNLDACVETCLKHGYRLCLQVHKIAGLS